MRVRTLNNPLSYRQRFNKKPWTTIFPDFKGHLDVEIGTGSGDFIQRYALNHPDRSIVGFEIRFKVFEQVQKNIDDLKIPNIHLCWGNGHIGLQDMFDDNSISRIFIFHPDPWPKNRHTKRRLLNTPFLDTVYAKLKPGGLMYIATDVSQLWTYMHSTILDYKNFTLLEHDTFWDEHYQSRWREISEEENRTLHYGTFEKNK